MIQEFGLKCVPAYEAGQGYAEGMSRSAWNPSLPCELGTAECCDLNGGRERGLKNECSCATGCRLRSLHPGGLLVGPLVGPQEP